MADKKISALNDGVYAVGTDEIVIVREGENYRLKVSEILQWAYGNEIDSPLLITELTNPLNWATGVYTGDMVGLRTGDWYIDPNLLIKYEVLTIGGVINVFCSQLNEVKPVL